MDKRFFDLKAMGHRIKALRYDNGLSCDSFAKEIGSFSVASVRRWESGRSAPSLAAVVAICNRFDVSADEIVLGFSSRETH